MSLATSLAATMALAQVEQPVSTLRDLGPALTRCFVAPERTAGSEITIRFSLNSSGARIGRPIVTFSHLQGELADKRAFVAAAFRALAACTPVHITPDLGATIAGRPLSVRFRSDLPRRVI